MLLVFGVGDTHEDLGPGRARTCPRCGSTTAWSRIRTSRRLTVFFIPVVRWGRREIERCTICGEAVAA